MQVQHIERNKKKKRDKQKSLTKNEAKIFSHHFINQNKKTKIIAEKKNANN